MKDSYLWRQLRHCGSTCSDATAPSRATAAAGPTAPADCPRPLTGTGRRPRLSQARSTTPNAPQGNAPSAERRRAAAARLLRELLLITTCTVLVTVVVGVAVTVLVAR
jgi:hypothetical protein